MWDIFKENGTPLSTERGNVRSELGLEGFTRQRYPYQTNLLGFTTPLRTQDRYQQIGTLDPLPFHSPRQPCLLNNLLLGALGAFHEHHCRGLRPAWRDCPNKMLKFLNRCFILMCFIPLETGFSPRNGFLTFSRDQTIAGPHGGCYVSFFGHLFNQCHSSIVRSGGKEMLVSSLEV